jgi:hypothetical protein
MKVVLFSAVLAIRGRLMMMVHHDDGKRMYAYGPKSKVCMFSDVLMAEAISNTQEPARG